MISQDYSNIGKTIDSIRVKVSKFHLVDGGGETLAAINITPVNFNGTTETISFSIDDLGHLKESIELAERTYPGLFRGEPIK